jgi:DNA replication protein DnaC
VTTLTLKLNQLSLTTMSRQLDQVIVEAAAKNLSLAQALETLTDLELESRNGRAIERRFRFSRLHAQHSIDSFHFKHHKSRMDLKNRLVRLLDLEFLHKGTSVILIGNPGVGKTFLAKIIGWRACQANQRVLFTTAMDTLAYVPYAESPECFPGRSLAGSQAPGLHRAIVVDHRRAGLSGLGPANLESVLSGHLHAPQS